MDLPRGYISYSQIRLYQTCPQKYYYTYVKKIPVPVNEKVFLGVVFHSVIEDYFREKIKGIELPIEPLLEQFAEKFAGLQKEQKIAWDEPQDQTLKRGMGFVKYFLRQVAPTIKPLMVEKELIADLPEINVCLKGVIDLVETDFSITDFKTTTARWTKSKIKGSYLQVVIYRYLFEKFFGDVISLLKFKIIYSKNPTNIKHQEINIKPKDVDYDYSKMFDVIKYVVDNIRQEVFYKNENFICGFCEFKEVCSKNSEPGR
ncbi:MAG: PD-(D/E)XK nuclease family protein [Candidatus Aminicenantes bacterium]|nr:MAG: PD-(D/E)XK nuclease family protein [Candidatus Aminicenantes bacterium]